MSEEFLTVRFTEQKSNPLVRGARGLYVNAQRQLAVSNQQMAAEVQALVVRNISNSILRKEVSSDRLVNVTASSGNIHSMPGGWQRGLAVGIPSYLDKSIARYWRTIEEGSEVTWHKRPFVGMELPGWFGGSISGLGRTGYGSRVFGGEPFTRAGKGTGGKFVPFAKKRRRSGAKFAVVQHEIQGQFAYTAAWEQYDGGGRVRKNLRDLLQAVGGNATYSGNFQGFGL